MVIAVCLSAEQPAQTPHFFCPPPTGPSDSSQADLEAVGAAAWQSAQTEASAVHPAVPHTHTQTAMIQSLVPFSFL